MEAQPVGASGKPIGATALVLLEVTVEDSGITQQVSCYVLDSSKPIWQGEVSNCSLVLGTNALGFMVSHCDGTVIEPTDSTTTKGSGEGVVFQISLQRDLRLGRFQTQTAHVRVNSAVPGQSISVGLICPQEPTMAPRECDFIESLWNGEHMFRLPITNWSKESLTLKKGTQVGELEEVSLISQENSVWDTLPYAAAAVRMVNEDN